MPAEIATETAVVVETLVALREVDHALPELDMGGPDGRAERWKAPSAVAVRLSPPSVPITGVSSLHGRLQAVVQTFVDRQDRPVADESQARAEARMVGVIASILRLDAGARGDSR